MNTLGDVVWFIFLVMIAITMILVLLGVGYILGIKDYQSSLIKRLRELEEINDQEGTIIELRNLIHRGNNGGLHSGNVSRD